MDAEEYENLVSFLNQSKGEIKNKNSENQSLVKSKFIPIKEVQLVIRRHDYSDFQGFIPIKVKVEKLNFEFISKFVQKFKMMKDGENLVMDISSHHIIFSRRSMEYQKELWNRGIGHKGMDGNKIVMFYISIEKCKKEWMETEKTMNDLDDFIQSYHDKPNQKQQQDDGKDKKT